jgi:hypothetical protein
MGVVGCATSAPTDGPFDVRLVTSYPSPDRAEDRWMPPEG